MNTERWHEAKAIAGAALELSQPERDTYVRAQCASDATLGAVVADFLREDGPAIADDFLRSPHSESLDSLSSLFVETALIGARLGSYRVSGLLATGGMGTVYQAERDDEAYRKRVAIKIVHAHRADPHWLRRFARERQALAALEHPSIIRLIDGGMTDDGRPYLVMEYVDGTSIDAYCHSRNLSIRDRLRLFCKVCEAVHVAHRSLIVHRDLKPANILVTEDGEPRLLDFGIAALMDPVSGSPTGETTKPSLQSFTPSYASPEQLRGEPVTTATDIFSLGVILYELLTAHAPFGRDPGSGFEHARRVCESEPLPPSVCAPKLANQLRGDLDNIVSMAMRKEPARRYATVRELSDDIRRHLEKHPVLARPNTLRYRAVKLIQRNRLASIGLALAVFSMVAGTVGTSVSLVRARRAGEEAIAQRQVAEERGAEAVAVTTFLQDTLAAANPFRGRDDLTIEALLQEASRRIDVELADKPAVEVGVRLAVARAYAGMWRWPDAAEQSAKALALARRYFSADDLRVADCLSILGRERTFAQDAVSVSMQEEALRIRRAHFGDSHPAVAESLGNLGYALWHGQPDARWNDAERHYRMSIDMYDRNGLQDSNDRARFTFSLAVMLRVQGRHDEAERAFSDAARIYRGTPSPEDRYRFECLHRYAALAADLGRLCKAEQLLREAEGLLQDHDTPAAAKLHWLLADVLHARGDRQTAVAMFRYALRSEMIDARKRHAAACNWDALLLSLDAPSDSLRAGADSLRTSFACLAGTMRPDRASLAQAILRTGHALCREGDHAGAESLFRIAVGNDAMGAETTSRWVVESGNVLARCLMHQNRNDEARRVLRDSLTAAPCLREDYKLAYQERDGLLALLAE